ncbi:MAG TPA: AAA family ATPase, partial [Trebonia sp.]|nr:AAA family ATPase [Trebonia sp.]
MEPDAAAQRACVMGGVVARPGLFERLDSAPRVMAVSAPPGSGKTVLLRSWARAACPEPEVAWVTVGRDERDPRRFWLAVADALRGRAPGAELVRPATAAPDLDGWTLMERLLTDLAPLAEPLWLVIDDEHELGPDALRQLQLLIMRAPPELRFVLASRRDMRLGLHRLRLEGGLAEIRGPDLTFSLEEAAELFAAAGVRLTESALATLHERTEGWAAGLRLAALSLAGHPDPERFAAEFSGSERTVAEYLLAEVLNRQEGEVRRLLLRTSILERVNGELADLLTGGSGGERVLQDLEQSGALVASLDPNRSWFRYHQLFAGLLRLELRRAEPGEVAGLHRTAAGWLAGHGYPAPAVRHLQEAGDWELAARLLADHWPGLYLDGQAAVIHELLAGFPPEASAADAELAALIAADELARRSLEAAARYLNLAERGMAAVPGTRRGQARLLLGIVRLLHARRRGDRAVVAGEAERLQALPGAVPPDAETGQPALDRDLRALTLISLGETELWAAQLDQAERHLEQGVALAQRIGRPFLEFTGLAQLAVIEAFRSFARAAERGRRVAELARRHGWTDEPAVGIAYFVLGAELTWQGRPAEAESWIQRAERTVRAEAEPTVAVGVCYIRAFLELARGADAAALAAFRAGERVARSLTAPAPLVMAMRTFQAQILARLGETDAAQRILREFGGDDPERVELRIPTAVLCLARDDPRGAAAALAPVLDGSASSVWSGARPVQAFLLEAIARDRLGDPAAADRALERALAEAEPDRALLWFLVHPVPGLLERQRRHRTSRAALVAEIQALLAGRTPAPPTTGPPPVLEPLSDS